MSCYFSGSSCTDLEAFGHFQLHGNTALLYSALLLIMLEASLVPSSKTQILFSIYSFTVHLQKQPPNQPVFMCYYRSQNDRVTTLREEKQTVKWTQRRPELWPNLNEIRTSNFILIFQLLDILLLFRYSAAFLMQKKTFQSVKEDRALGALLFIHISLPVLPADLGSKRVSQNYVWRCKPCNSSSTYIIIISGY